MVKALRSHDDELAEQLDGFRRRLGRAGQRPRLPGKIHLDLPARVGVDFARAFDVRVVEQTTASWEFWFGLLERFVERNGHARVPWSYTIDGYQLAKWVQRQRVKNTKGTLHAYHQHRLQTLPGWAWDAHAEWWEEGFRRLLDYVELYGDSRVPVSYAVDGFKVGGWVNVQRDHYADGTLGVDRQRRLQGVPGWTWTPHADRWEEGFRRLVQYVERRGDANVPRDYKLDGYPLGRWVGKQRVHRSRGTLDIARQQRLQEVTGWTWDPHADRWEESFRRLLDYVERHGDAALIHRSYKADGYPLGLWVKEQRKTYNDGTLDADRAHRLQDVPGWTWNPQTDQWEKGFTRLLHYVDRHGDARVPSSRTFDGYRLGQWVLVQRFKYSKGILDVGRQRRLQELPGWTWDTNADRWGGRFSLPPGLRRAQWRRPRTQVVHRR